jgi:hypothetical protein
VKQCCTGYITTVAYATVLLHETRCTVAYDAKLAYIHACAVDVNTTHTPEDGAHTPEVGQTGLLLSS